MISFADYKQLLINEFKGRLTPENIAEVKKTIPADKSIYYYQGQQDALLRVSWVLGRIRCTDPGIIKLNGDTMIEIVVLEDIINQIKSNN